MVCTAVGRVMPHCIEELSRPCGAKRSVSQSVGSHECVTKNVNIFSRGGGCVLWKTEQDSGSFSSTLNCTSVACIHFLFLFGFCYKVSQTATILPAYTFLFCLRGDSRTHGLIQDCFIGTLWPQEAEWSSTAELNPIQAKCFCSFVQD